MSIVNSESVKYLKKYFENRTFSISDNIMLKDIKDDMEEKYSRLLTICNSFEKDSFEYGLWICYAEEIIKYGEIAYFYTLITNNVLPVTLLKFILHTPNKALLSKDEWYRHVKNLLGWYGDKYLMLIDSVNREVE